MSEPLLNRLLVPVADEADAEATCKTIRPYVEAGTTEILVLHIIETSDGATDNPPPEPLDSIFEPFRDAFESETVSVDATTRSGADPIDEIAQIANDADVTAIAVLPRRKNLLARFLPKEKNITELVSQTDAPIVVFPQNETTTGTAQPTIDEETGDWTPSLLIPFGESDRSLEAVAFACRAYPNPRLIGLHVFTASDTDVYSEITPGISNELDEADTKRQQRVKARFRKAIDRADQEGIKMETVIAPGDVVKAILHYAREESADMIVVGLADPNQANERTFGQLSKSLVRKSPVPVVFL